MTFNILPRLILLAGAITLAACSDTGAGEVEQPDSVEIVGTDVSSEDMVTQDMDMEDIPVFEESYDAETLLARLQSTSPLMMDMDSTGVVLPATSALGASPYIAVSASGEVAASGNTVTVTVRAKSATGTGRLGVAYYTNEVGNSGLREFDLGDLYQEFAFDYDVPEMIEGKFDLIRIVSDLDSDGTGAVVASMSVSVR